MSLNYLQKKQQLLKFSGDLCVIYKVVKPFWIKFDILSKVTNLIW